MSINSIILEISKDLSSLNWGSFKSLSNQLSKLIAAGGGLPVTPEILQRIARTQASEKLGVDEISNIIVSDPVFALRIISTCNSSFYARGHSIITIDNAVNHLGLLRIREVGEGLGKLASYEKSFQGRSIAACVYQQQFLTSLLAERFYNTISRAHDQRRMLLFMSGISDLWPMLLAFSKPHLYSSCMINAISNGHISIDKVVRKLSKKSLSDLGAEFLKEVGLPDELIEVYSLLRISPWIRRSWPFKSGLNAQEIATATYLAGRVVEEINACRGYQSLAALLRELSAKVSLPRNFLSDSLSGIMLEYIKRVKTLGMIPLRLPSYLAQFNEEIVEEGGELRDLSASWDPVNKRLKSFLFELKTCLALTAKGAEEHLGQAVYCSLLALLRGLNFDRAVYFSYSAEERLLKPLLLLGSPVEEFNECIRYVSSSGQEHMPDVKAIFEERPVFHGDPVFDNDWPFVAFPVITNGHPAGVFYADKTASKNAEPLTVEEQVAVIAMAEEWHNVRSDSC